MLREILVQAETETDLRLWLTALQAWQGTKTGFTHSSPGSMQAQPIIIPNGRPTRPRSKTLLRMNREPGYSSFKVFGEQPMNESPTSPPTFYSAANITTTSRKVSLSDMIPIKREVLLAREAKRSDRDIISPCGAWRKAVCVLSDRGVLALFSDHDKTLLLQVSLPQIPRSHIQLMDESLFPAHRNCFCVGTTVGAWYFSVSSQAERNQWVSLLKAHAAPDWVRAPDGERLRIFRTFWLRVNDARDLRAIQPYCEIVLDCDLRARTSVQRQRDLYWREDFTFLDLPPFKIGVTLLVKSAERHVGRVFIPIRSVRRGVLYEGWYPIMSDGSTVASSGGGGYLHHHVSEHVGDLRIKLLYDEVVVLPIEEYEEVEKYFFSLDAKATFELANSCPELERVAMCMLRVHEARGLGAVKWINAMASEEVATTTIENTSILFRGNSLLTKAIDVYMKMICVEYIDTAIGDKIRLICSARVVCEVDPSKLGQDEDVNAHWRTLIAHARALWRGIWETREKCPRELREVFAHLQHLVMEKYQIDKGESGLVANARYTCVSGFIFLRLICPAVLAPKHFGLVQEHPDPKTHRTLTLLAKSLQNLANLVPFGSKETYMVNMNEFINENMSSLMEFIDYIATPCDSAPSQKDGTESVTLTSPSSYFESPTPQHLIDLPKELACLSGWIASFMRPPPPPSSPPRGEVPTLPDLSFSSSSIATSSSDDETLRLLRAACIQVQTRTQHLREHTKKPAVDVSRARSPSTSVDEEVTTPSRGMAIKPRFARRDPYDEDNGEDAVGHDGKETLARSI
ncbi:uncharacterized protein VTP21DRAFT_1259 [Calcarisporiella thermophila]|uniref:uncharacterized protein n=1 Tax=Calcarisporiella thermophila TaxID=911321 RepID=UPI003743B8E5